MSLSRQILCEGYHDRAFWYGLLEYLGCQFRKELRLPSHGKAAGEYVGETPDGGFVSIVPVDGVRNLLPSVETRLLQHEVKPIQHLIVNRDADTEVGESGGMQVEQLLQLAQRVGIPAHLNADRDIQLDNDKMKVSLVRWETSDSAPLPIPTQQTLERMVCIAIHRVYPERTEEVNRWLQSRSHPPSYDVKEVAWSYMAGWYADSGCEDFYRSLWRDTEVAAELKQILRHNGSWRVAEALVQNTG